MGKLIREYWAWVVVPFVLVVALVVWLMWMSTDGGSSDSPFTYQVF